MVSCYETTINFQITSGWFLSYGNRCLYGVLTKNGACARDTFRKTEELQDAQDHVLAEYETWKRVHSFCLAPLCFKWGKQDSDSSPMWSTSRFRASEWLCIPTPGFESRWIIPPSVFLLGVSDELVLGVLMSFIGSNGETVNPWAMLSFRRKVRTNWRRTQVVQPR